MRTTSSRRPRHRRLVIAIVAATLALIVLPTGIAAAWFVGGATPAPFSIAAAAPAPAALADGTWTIRDGMAGYRARESGVGLGHEVVGRTDAVTGRATTAGGALTAARVEVPLTAFTVNGRRHPETSSTVNAGSHPVASFVVTAPVALGGTGAIDVPGTLTLNGTERQVTWRVAARPAADGSLLMTGRADVDIRQWGVEPPSSAPFRIEPAVVLEFQVSWVR